MPIQRPSLQKTMIQIELNRFYEKPMARISATLFLSLLSIAFFALAAIRPTLQTMAVLLKQIDEKKSLDTQLSQKITALTAAQRNLLEKQDLFPALDLAIPPTAQFSLLMTAVEKLASEHSITFVSAQTDKVPLEERSIGSSKRKLTLISYPMTLTFSGSYENLVGFMRELVSLKRIIVIDRFDLSNKSKDLDSKGSLTLTVAIRAFSFRQVGNQ